MKGRYYWILFFVSMLTLGLTVISFFTFDYDTVRTEIEQRINKIQLKHDVQNEKLIYTSKSLKSLDQLNISIESGEVNLKHGDSCRVQIYVDQDKDVTYDKILTVEETENRMTIKNKTNSGFRYPVYIEITAPDFNRTTADVSLFAGEIKINETLKQGKFNFTYGTATINGKESYPLAINSVYGDVNLNFTHWNALVTANVVDGGEIHFNGTSEDSTLGTWQHQFSEGRDTIAVNITGGDLTLSE